MGYSYEMIKNILSYAVALSPDSAFPLDARAYFGSYDAAFTAAQSAKPAGSTESVYFYGQQLYVVENDVVTTYLIQTDNTLKEVGSATLGDEKTISLGEDGILSLKNFGKRYYAYVPADVVIEGTFATADELPTEGVNAGEYAKVGDTYYKYDGSAWAAAEAGFKPKTQAEHVLTEGWQAGLEPKVVAAASGDGYELAWYEPSSTTVEGLNSIVAGVQTSVSNLNDAVVANKAAAEQAVVDEKTAREAADKALDEKIGTNTSAIAILNGGAENEGSVLHTVNTVLAQLVGDGSQETIDSLTELVEWANSHSTEIIEMNNAIEKNKTDISGLATLLGTLPEGVTATTVVAYIAEAVKAEETRALAAEKALSDRLDTAEATLGGLGTAAQKNEDDFATAEQGAKADSAVQNVVASDNGYVAVDNDKVKVYELPSAKVNELGGMRPDGASIVTDENGVASVSAVDHTKVTGLDTRLSNTQQAAEENAQNYTNENAVAKASVVATAADAAASVDEASADKVASEKLILELFTWKTEM